MTTRLYEGMFLLDNQLVREDWSAAKAVVTGLVEKHGGTVRTARHWEERRLAYPIKKKNRATFLLTYSEMPTDAIPTLSRDLELSEQVLRYLITSAPEIPEKEQELAKNETASDFVLPEPPPDDHSDEPEPEPESERRDRGDRGDRGDRRPRSEARPKEETKSEETKAEVAEAPKGGDAPPETGAPPPTDATPETGATPESGATPDAEKTPKGEEA